jgi:tryptophan synthase beta chain
MLYIIKRKKKERVAMTNKEIPYKIYLEEQEMPKQWYNVRADMKKKPAPILNPATLQPVTVDDMSGIFCRELAKQELDDTTPYFDIPEEILGFYRMYRPSPLVRAYCLEKKLGTPAHIYYKFEGNNTSGSHKLNSAIAQAYYAKKQGLKGVTTETGAGQWGTALSMACSYFDLDCQVYMVKCSYEQKPFRREVMRTYGATVTPSPSMNTEVGRKINEQFPGTTGSLGCAISEAVEAAVTQDGYRYVLGSVLSQVLLHQSVIGLETKTALDKYGIKADMIIGCAGGGSNLGGLISPFAGEILRGEADYEIIAVEPASCPSLTRGVYAYDFCDTGKVCPLAKMYTLGNSFIPSPNHAGGLRYHGMSSVVSELYDQGIVKARSVEQTEVFKAAEAFARIEGILPAPESSHAIKVAMDEALKCKETGEAKNIVFGLTGTGYFDMVAYEKYNDGVMDDVIPTDEQLQASFATLPKVE